MQLFGPESHSCMRLRRVVGERLLSRPGRRRRLISFFFLHTRILVVSPAQRPSPFSLHYLSCTGPVWTCFRPAQLPIICGAVRYNSCSSPTRLGIYSYLFVNNEKYILSFRQVIIIYMWVRCSPSMIVVRGTKKI